MVHFIYKIFPITKHLEVLLLQLILVITYKVLFILPKPLKFMFDVAQPNFIVCVCPHIGNSQNIIIIIPKLKTVEFKKIKVFEY